MPCPHGNRLAAGVYNAAVCHYRDWRITERHTSTWVVSDGKVGD